MENKLEGFESGADDYLVKPFALQELEARLKALVRRATAAGNRRRLEVADLCFDLETLEVTRGGRLLALTKIELEILRLLLERSPAVVRRQEIVARVWGEDAPDSNTLRSHIHGVRAAVDKPFETPLIRTVHGIGYRLSP